MINNRGDMIRKKLEELSNAGSLPTQEIKPGTILFRMQDTGYKEGYNYSAPAEDTEMGRYNDPNGKLRVTYLAETPVLALGESFLRRGRPIFLSSSDLSIFDMAVVGLESPRPILLLDMSRLLPLLDLRLDEVSNADYSFTQEIIRFFSDNPSCVDGVSYIGRHYAAGKCIVFFEPKDPEVRLVTQSLDKLVNFTCPISGYDCEEILTTMLDIKVISH